LEDSRLQPGDVADAYERWRRFVTGSIRSLEWISEDGGGGPYGHDYLRFEYYDDPDFGRRVLEAAVFMLPVRASRELRLEIEKLDEVLMVRARRAGASHDLLRWWN
jgi:hypothetical protein